MKKLSYRPQAGSISMGRDGRVDLQNAPSACERGRGCSGNGTRYALCW